MANCKTIVAGELFQAARRPQARSARDGVPSLTSPSGEPERLATAILPFSDNKRPSAGESFAGRPSAGPNHPKIRSGWLQ